MNKTYFKEPYEVIAAKVELAEIGLELYRVRTAKVNTVKDLLEKEEALEKQFNAKSQEIQVMIDNAM